jgi:uncharacterized protein DUF5996
MALRTSEWPALPLERWRDTYATLHMWTQIVGKVCLALTPLENHFWNIAFRVTSRGLATREMSVGQRSLQMTFDFVAHQLRMEVSDGSCRIIPLEPRTVADFYALTMGALRELGVAVRIWPVPVEIPDPIRFTEDVVHRSYDPESAHAFWMALLTMKPVFEGFRCGFIGKCSPVHFFWGSFDLAVTRFSGRRAPERPGADSMTRESYSHEVISHGFWPGSGPVQEAAFYAYAAPAPEGLPEAAVEPAAAYYHREMGEFILPYDAVRLSEDPAAELAAFLNTTYDASSRLAGWNRDDLERRRAT